MTRAHKGHYRAKHPEGTQVSADLEKAVSQSLIKGRIACASAFTIAEKLNVPPNEVGKAIDLQEGRIHACQLGLFGYGAKDKRVQKAASVSSDLEAAIRQHLKEGRLACRHAWQIADDLKIQRIEVSQASETLQIRISQCQLGAF